jgi:hypothetical protein
MHLSLNPIIVSRKKMKNQKRCLTKLTILLMLMLSACDLTTPVETPLIETQTMVSMGEP